MLRTIVSTKGTRQWQGIPAIERAHNGRLWSAFFSGGFKEPEPENYILLTTCEDDGVTWSDPQIIAAPPGLTRAYDPALWHDPNGCLWLFYNQANLEEKDYSVWVMTTHHSQDAVPKWSAPRRIDLNVPFAFRLNKPTVLTTGEWLLPVTWSQSKPEGWFAGSQQLQGVAFSSDLGVTWTLAGAVKAPEWALENMIVEKLDGTLWMLIRTGSGVLWESVSNDHGRNWSEAAPTRIINPGSRFFIRRLNSGRLLLINTPNATQRTKLYAYISDLDDGTSFGQGLELDGRDKVSYPDAVQATDGIIYAVHDCDRQGVGEIVLNKFSEDEILVSR